MWHSVLFTLLTTPLLIILPLAFAIFAARLVHNKWFFRLAFFAPYVVPSSAVCLIFAFMYTPQTGLITKAFGWVGLSSPNFLGSTSGAWAAVVLLTLWWTFGFNFILYTAAIQDISEELYEAAAIDGASPWQQIRMITVPLLNPTTSLVLILQILASLKVFDQIYILLSGGPNESTRTRHRIHLRHRLHLLPRRLRLRGDHGVFRPARRHLRRLDPRASRPLRHRERVKGYLNP